jgi:hypothetical protein
MGTAGLCAQWNVEQNMTFNKYFEVFLLALAFSNCSSWAQLNLSPLPTAFQLEPIFLERTSRSRSLNTRVEYHSGLLTCTTLSSPSLVD